MENNKYHFPCDEEELRRLDSLQFAMRVYLDGKNILVPFGQKPTNILDVGTGSGAWCIEVSNEYPETNVRGIDLSPVQPTFIPRNCEFIAMDLTEGLDFDEASQDLVHSRYLAPFFFLELILGLFKRD
jgi:ubiquinone/menaquinone biosynthesis C-methylase UbiE